MEPVARDPGSLFTLQAFDHAKIEVHQHLHLGSIDANAIQNSVGRFLGPSLPAREIKRDVLLVLDQVKNSPTAKTGDRGVIEEIWHLPVKLRFMSEEAKRKVLELQDNPFKSQDYTLRTHDIF